MNATSIMSILNVSTFDVIVKELLEIYSTKKRYILHEKIINMTLSYQS